MTLKVNLKKNEEGVFIISPVGSIDSNTYQILQEKFTLAIEQTRKGVIIDMAGVDYISSIGFAIITRAKQALAKKCMGLAIVGLQPNVKRIFDSVKAIPNGLFAELKEADDYLDQYIDFISDDKRCAKGEDQSGK